jgi:hypothetical protein
MHRRSNAAGLKSVVHFEVLFFRVDDEVIVDSDLAEFICMRLSFADAAIRPRRLASVRG